MKKKENLKNSMLVSLPPHLSHALSSMHRECIYAWNKYKGKKKSPQVGDYGGDLICPRNAAQSNLRGVQRKPPETSIIQPIIIMYIWMIFIKNFTPSNFQNFKIISESILSTPLSQNGVWKDGLI